MTYEVQDRGRGTEEETDGLDGSIDGLSEKGTTLGTDGPTVRTSRQLAAGPFLSVIIARRS